MELTTTRSFLLKMGMWTLTTGLLLLTYWTPAPERTPQSIEREASKEFVDISPPDAASYTLQLDVNQATADDLQRLPGIGPVLAQRIVERRARIGTFRSLDELLSVKGIGIKRLERLRSYMVPIGKQRASAVETFVPTIGLCRVECVS